MTTEIIILALLILGVFWVHITNAKTTKDKHILFANCANVYVISARHELDDSVEAVAESLRAKLAECQNPNGCKVIALPYNTVHNGVSTLGMDFPTYRQFVREIEAKEWERYHLELHRKSASYASDKFAGQNKNTRVVELEF